MARSVEGTSRRLWVALAAGLSHWLLTITVQVGDFLEAFSDGVLAIIRTGGLQGC